MEYPVQSSSKSSTSDFSIERILREEPKSSRESPPPSWLCCTRYRPPRLARAPNPSFRSRRSGRHARVPFSAGQAAALEAAYSRAPYLAPPALRALASALQLRDDRIKIWFQNRRARERREKCVVINPPQAVTLPPSFTNIPPHSHTVPWTNSNQEYVSPTNHERNRIIASSSSEEDCELEQDSLIYKGYRDEASPESPLDVETID